MKCPECGKFVKNPTATIRAFTNEIVKVTGKCKKHGKVEPTDWEYDNFFRDEDYNNSFIKWRRK